MSMVKDVGAYILARNNVPQNAGTTAGTAVNGGWLDRRSLGSHYQSCKVVVPFSYVKATGTTISVTARLQQSSAGSTVGMSGLSTGTATTVAAGVSATATTVGQAFADVELTTAQRYLRVQVSPQISVVSSVNALNCQGTIVFGGADVNPAA